MPVEVNVLVPVVFESERLDIVSRVEFSIVDPINGPDTISRTVILDLLRPLPGVALPEFNVLLQTELPPGFPGDLLWSTFFISLPSFVLVSSLDVVKVRVWTKVFLELLPVPVAQGSMPDSRPSFVFGSILLAGVSIALIAFSVLDNTEAFKARFSIPGLDLSGIILFSAAIHFLAF